MPKDAVPSYTVTYYYNAWVGVISWSINTVCCEKTGTRLMYCIVCSQDIVAVGYGTFTAKSPTQGLICCWSLKNPEVRYQPRPSSSQPRTRHVVILLACTHGEKPLDIHPIAPV